MSRYDPNVNPPLVCVKCRTSADDLEEYDIHIDPSDPSTPQTRAEAVWQEEGTLNRATGEFLCTPCYIAAGQPTSRFGWIVPSGI